MKTVLIIIMLFNFSFLKSEPLLVWNNYKIPLIEKNDTIDWEGTKQTFYKGYIIKDENEYQFKIDLINVEYWAIDPSTMMQKLSKTTKNTHEVTGKIIDTLTKEELIKKLDLTAKVENLKGNPTISLKQIDIISNTVNEMEIEKFDLTKIKSFILNSKANDKINVRFKVLDELTLGYSFNLIFVIK